MDSNKLRVDAHRAAIARNIQGSTANFDQAIEKGETISIGQFQERLEKGESFLSEPQISRFLNDTQKKIVDAFTTEAKEEIRKSVDNELNLLKAVKVVNETGQEFQFFSRISE